MEAPEFDCSQRSSTSLAKAMACAVVLFCAGLAIGWSEGNVGQASGGCSLRHALSFRKAALNVELAPCCPTNPADPGWPAELSWLAI